MNDRNWHSDDRAVSIAVTHILAIGITTVLVSGLLIGAGAMLDGERERSAQGSLETIGERLGGEITAAHTAADGTVTVQASHPSRVAGTSYTVELDDSCSAEPLIESDLCIRLSADNEDVDVAVPLSEDIEIGPDSEQVRGGSMTIIADGDNVELTERDS